MQNKKDEPLAFKILSPKIDVVFKLLFGDKRNIEILTDFLESVLDLPETEYESIVIEDTHLKRETVDDKSGIVDVKVLTQSGKIVHIEIQVLELPEMPEMVTYYNSRILATQLKSGESYNSLQKTISIAITNFDMIMESPEYHHIFQLRDSLGIKFTDVIEIHTLELTKIPNCTDNTKKYDWLKFIRAEKEDDFMLATKKNPVIKKAYAELRRLSADEEAQRLAENREKALRDEYARNKFNYDKGVREGIREGIREGAKDNALKTAREMLKDGLEIDLILRYTGLPLSEVKEIQLYSNQDEFK